MNLNDLGYEELMEFLIQVGMRIIVEDGKITNVENESL